MQRRMLAGGALFLGALLVSGLLRYSDVANRDVLTELRTNPGGERAQKVMALTLPSGQTIPVNYLREDLRTPTGQLREVVYAGADFPWWRELRGDGAAVEVFVAGELRAGRARAIENDPEARREVFSRLRPTALSFAGTLVEIELAPLD